MIEPVSSELDMTELVDQVLQASSSVHQLIEGFESQEERVRDLLGELISLTEALGSLKGSIDSPSGHKLTSLALPLQHCRASCDQVQKSLTSFDGNVMVFRDWTISDDVSEGINGFRQLISCYTYTVRIAFTTVTFPMTKVTAGTLLLYKELLRDAQAVLEDRLGTVTENMELLGRNAAHIAVLGDNQLAHLRDEISSTQQCLGLCAQFSQHISELQRMCRLEMTTDISKQAQMACIVLADSTRVDSAKLIGSGIDGFVVRMGHNVLKAPKLFGYIAPDGEIRPDRDNELHVTDLEVEKQVYARLGNAPGIAECMDVSSNGILLKFYSKGSLDAYMAQHDGPTFAVRFDWILQATNALKHCHDNNVLVYDIALRNLLLTEELTLKMIDFANSSLLPADADVSKANEDGCTPALDLLHLSNVIYSICAWKDFHIECASEDEWPDTESMPDISGLAIASIVQNCWAKQYATVDDLLRDLYQLTPHSFETVTAANLTRGDQYVLPTAQVDGSVVVS